MSRLAPWLALVWVGCMTEERFREEADEAMCGWMADCLEDVHEEECLADAADAWTPVPGDCSFQRAKARKCVRQIRKMECPAELRGGWMPEECDEVWECDGD